MRDPERIDKFCKILAQAWHKVPDWRFGQLFMNLPFTCDPFFMEDDEMENLIRNYFHIDETDGEEEAANGDAETSD